MSPIYCKWETIRSYSSLQTHAYAEWAWEWWYARKWKWHDNKSSAFFRSQNPRQINCSLILYILYARKSYKFEQHFHVEIPCDLFFNHFFGNLIKRVQGYSRIRDDRDALDLGTRYLLHVNDKIEQPWHLSLNRHNFILA